MHLVNLYAILNILYLDSLKFVFYFKIVIFRHFKIKMNLTKKINLPNKDINLTPSVTYHSPTVQSRLLSFLLTKKQRSSNFAHRLASKMRFESLPIEIKPPIPTLCSGIPQSRALWTSDPSFYLEWSVHSMAVTVPKTCRPEKNRSAYRRSTLPNGNTITKRIGRSAERQLSVRTDRFSQEAPMRSS